MEQALQERLTILKEAGMMDRHAEDVVHHIVDKLHADGVPITDETIGMFLTHLIAALSRTSSKEAITEVNAELKEELLKNPFYPKAKQYFAELNDKLGVQLEEAEEAYVGGYLCILLSQGKGGIV